MQIRVCASIDQVDGVVCCVSDVEYSGFVVDCGVVEAAFLLVCWQLYVADVSEKVRDLLGRLCDVVLQFLSTFRLELAVLVQRVIGWKL